MRSKLTKIIRRCSREKSGLFIAAWMKAAHNEKVASPTLTMLCERIIRYATNPEVT